MRNKAFQEIVQEVVKTWKNCEEFDVQKLREPDSSESAHGSNLGTTEESEFAERCKGIL